MTTARSCAQEQQNTTTANIIYYNHTVSLSLSSSYDLIAECMEAQLGYLPNDRTRRQIVQLLQQGAAAEMVCAVIEYTKQYAPRPSWAYAHRVACNQLELGNTTAEAFSAAAEAFWSRKAAPLYKPGFFTAARPDYSKQLPAQQYSQREYDQREIDLTDIITTTKDMLESGLITPDAAEKALAAAKSELAELQQSPRG